MTHKQTFVPTGGGPALTMTPSTSLEKPPPGGVRRPKTYTNARPTGSYQKGSAPSRPPGKVTGPKKTPDNIISMEQFRLR